MLERYTICFERDYVACSSCTFVRALSSQMYCGLCHVILRQPPGGVTNSSYVAGVQVDARW